MIQNAMKERETREMKPMYRPENMRPARPFGPEWFTPFFDDFFAPTPWRNENALPAMNVLETEKDYTVQLAVPGMTKEDFSITLGADDTLIIKATRKGNSNDNSKENSDKHRPHYLRREFGFARFEESLTLPDDTNKEAISATVENGVLTIELPKKSAEDLAAMQRVICIK